MPLYKIIKINADTEVFIWQITESYEKLSSEIHLNESNTLRINGMKSELHRRAFLSVRKLLQYNNYSDFDLFYDQFGKPNLKDGRHISITHSHNFAAIVLSNQNVGIDMEKQREKIMVIADKFSDFEFTYLNKNVIDDYVRKLTVIWGVKESVFKITNEIGISFKDHIKVLPFSIEDYKTTAILDFENKQTFFEVIFAEVENFTIVFAKEK